MGKVNGEDVQVWLPEKLIVTLIVKEFRSWNPKVYYCVHKSLPLVPS
jgi:hypothetical protein